MPPQERPASLDEIISAIAKKEGVAPALALAVAKRESSMKPDAVGDSGKAIGLFQLHEGAAADTGTANRADPVQNITGGVKYLRQLSDRYQGDVNKILMAYNGGMGNVDSGKISPQAQQYATEILAQLSVGQKAPGAPAVKPNLQPSEDPTNELYEPPLKPENDKRHLGRKVEPKAPGMLQSMVSSFDPRTTEGQINLGSTAAATAATAWMGGVGGPAVAAGTAARAVAPALARGVAPWLARILTAPAAAAAGGGAVSAAQHATGRAPEGALTPVQEGMKQGAYELGGQAFMWLPRRVARTFLSSTIGRQARTTLQGMKTAAAGAMKSASETGSAMIQSAKNTADDVVSSVKATGQSALDAVRGDVRGARVTAERVGTEGVQRATEQAQKSLADAELEAADLVANAGKEYESISGAPSVQGAAESTRKVLRGLPGIPSASAGPAKKALDMAGEEIEKAAATGPAIATRPLKDALNAMAEQARPAALFQQTGGDTTKNIGFLANVSPRAPQPSRAVARASGTLFEKQLTGAIKPVVGASPPPESIWKGTPPPKVGGASANEIANFQKQMAKSLGISEDHPLPGILGQILDAPDNITFKEAHALKRQLDEKVNWDITAKKHLTQITKGIRETLRGAMRDAGNPAYEAATSKYGQLVPLYRKGVGLEILKAAADNPDKIARMLRPNAPDQAIRLRKLLVDQSAEGGDAEAGQQAWDAVRSNFTYDKVIKGGIEKMGERLKGLVEGHPEFAREVFGDEQGQQILSNLDKIAEAYKTAAAQAGERVTAAKATGKAGIEAAKDRGAAGLKETKEVGDVALETKRRETAAQIDAARKSGRTAVQAATEARRTAVGAEKTKIEGVRAQERRLRESSIGSGSKKEVETAVADTARAAVLSGTIWGMLSAVRLLNGPKSADLLEWAAYSSKNTETLTKLLMGQLPDRAASDAMRAVMGGISEAPESQASGQ